MKQLKRKSSLIIGLIICLFLSISMATAYFCNTTILKNKFKTISYSFDLNGNGGIYSPVDIEITKNKTILPTPVRNGYTFTGYSDSSTGDIITVNNVSDINLINNKTIYAKWELKSYSITYNLNGGIISNQKVNYSINDNFSLVNPTRTGYNFIGWTGSNGNVPQKKVTINKGTTGNKTYTANWEKIDAAITGITIVSYRSEDYGESYETWYGNADGYYSFGTSNQNAGNWNVSVSNHSVSVVGTTKVTSKNRYYKFYIYAGEGRSTLLGVVEDHPVEYRGSGTKAKISYSW